MSGEAGRDGYGGEPGLEELWVLSLTPASKGGGEGRDYGEDGWRQPVIVIVIVIGCIRWLHAGIFLSSPSHPVMQMK